MISRVHVCVYIAAAETAVEKQQRVLQEQKVAEAGVHSSQQKIRVVSLTLKFIESKNHH